MHEQVPAFQAALSANGGADGYVTFASNAGIYPGARGYLNSSAQNQYVLITDLSGTTKAGIRFIAESDTDPKVQAGTVKPTSMGRNDCSAFTTAQAATLFLPQQVVPVIQPAFLPAYRP